jgi:DNA-binding MarR family transcriptional regulator
MAVQPEMGQPERAASEVLRLKQAEAALRRRLAPLLDEYLITLEHWQVLAALQEHPGIRMTELAEFAAVPPASLTRHVDRLAELALVVRRIDPGDRRRAVVALSRRGEQLAARLMAAEAGAQLRLRS